MKEPSNIRLSIWAASFFGMLGFGFVHQSIWMNAGMWACFFFFYATKKHVWFDIPIVIGGAMNAAATLSNGGRMPVAGVSGDLGWRHQAMTSATHLKWLCDVHHRASVGDAFVVGGVLGAIVWAVVGRWVWKKQVIEAAA